MGVQFYTVNLYLDKTLYNLTTIYHKKLPVFKVSIASYFHILYRKTTVSDMFFHSNTGLYKKINVDIFFCQKHSYTGKTIIGNISLFAIVE